MAAERYSDYDPFAWLYNRHWGNVFTSAALAAIDGLLSPPLQADARILDLCCGTGQLAEVLVDRGYRVTGIDGSAQMLRYARKNVPDVEFILDDARSFRLRHRYDAVVSVFDSLNHVSSIEDLARVFRRVHAALKNSGLFLFDLNLEPGYLVEWTGLHGIVENDHVCVFRNSYDIEKHEAKFEATLFRLRDGWRRSDFTLLQKSYPVSEVLGALEGEGFVDIRTRAYEFGEGLKELAPDSGRAIFVCRRPAT